MERKSKNRIRLVNLRPVGGESSSDTPPTSTQVVSLALGYRVVLSEQAEVWTLSGLLADGTVAKEVVGELSFVLIPGDEEPAVSVTGFVSAAAPYVLTIPEEQARQEVRNVVTQLGYDRDGYYLSLSIGGTPHYEEHINRP